ncbi:MAG: rubredoxin [Candidatus Hermodarchaeota archaeon]
MIPIYRCRRCNYLYIDEEREVPFEQVSDDYSCPKCRSSKNFFLKKELPK